jgi:hypothetical protein
MSATADPSLPLIDPSVASFIQSGVSITVAARGDRLVPSITKAVGCHVDAAGREVSVLLFADAGEPVCRDVARNGLVAVCFSRPSTNRTVQIKGSNATSALATPQDVAHARRCLDLLIDDLTPLGFDRRMLEAFFWGDPADLMAIRFAPDAAFAQTPGPGAGAALKSPGSGAA